MFVVQTVLGSKHCARKSTNFRYGLVIFDDAVGHNYVFWMQINKQGTDLPLGDLTNFLQLVSYY